LEKIIKESFKRLIIVERTEHAGYDTIAGKERQEREKRKDENGFERHERGVT